MVTELTVMVRKTINEDNGCMNGFELEVGGFHPTWSYPTGDEERFCWEFDLVHKATGLETHVTIPWTTSSDVLETLLFRELARLLRSIGAAS